MKTLKFLVAVTIVAQLSCVAFELAVNNQSGAPVGVGDGVNGWVVQPGQAKLQAGGNLVFNLGTNGVVAVAVDGYDFTVFDQLRVTAGTTNVVVDSHSMSGTAGFWSGWTLGCSVFGLAWFLRIVRNIHSHQIET